MEFTMRSHRFGKSEISARLLADQGRQKISIKALLEWAFGVEKVQLDFDEFGSRNIGIEAVLIEQAQLGCKVDGGGWSPRASDAEIVAAVVAGLPAAQGGKFMAIEIAEYARAGMMPDSLAGMTPQLVPSEWKWSKKHRREMAREMVYGIGTIETSRWPNPKNPTTWLVRHAKYEQTYCPCRLEPSAGKIAAARRHYLQWWAALLHLQDAMRTVGLEKFEVTTSMPTLAPWQ